MPTLYTKYDGCFHRPDLLRRMFAWLLRSFRLYVRTTEEHTKRFGMGDTTLSNRHGNTGPNAFDMTQVPRIEEVVG
jgi:hypothetical protein